MRREQMFLEQMSTPQVEHTKRIVDRELLRRKKGGKPRKPATAATARKAA